MTGEIQNAKGKVMIITTHPFWNEPLGCGSLMRDRLGLLSQVFDEVFTLYLTATDDKCPLKGGTIKFDGIISDELCSAVNRIIKNFGIDVCYFSYIQRPELVNSLDSFNVAEIHDVLHLRQASFKQFGFDAPNPSTKSDELLSLQAFDCLLCLSLTEVHYLNAQGIANVVWLPPVSDYPDWRSNPRKMRTGVGFLGSCSLPNIHGITSIIPLLNQHQNVHLAGPISSAPEIDDLLEESIYRHGVVQETTDFYSLVHLTLSPIFFGAGLKIKVYESLLFGIGVLATDCSIDGFPPGIHDIVTINNNPGGWDLDTVEAALNYDQTKIREYMMDYFTLAHGTKILREALAL